MRSPMRCLIAIGVFLAASIGNNVLADTNIVTCPEWRSKQQLYVSHPKRAALLAPTAPKGFVDVYRAIAAILGSERMSVEVHTALETSGYGDLSDVLLSMHFRGGLPDDFIEAVKRFHKSGKMELDAETYVIDIKTQEMISKLRRSYCK